MDSHRFLWLTIFLIIVSHAAFLTLPPKSMHLWRQCNTLAMARNLFEEGMNPLLPRVDNRLDTDGITGSQFPSFEFGLASLYWITGEQFWVQRSYCLLLAIFGMLGMYALAKQLTGNRLFSVLVAWTYAWSPLLFYYSITALPDDLALPCSIWGLFFFLKWVEQWVIHEQNNTVWMIGSLVLLTLTGLTKIQYLAVGFFMATYLGLQKDKLRLSHWLVFSGFGIICCALSITWYLYANYLIEISGLKDFGLEFKPEDNFRRGLSTLFSNLTQNLPESLLNYASFGLLLAGCFYLFHSRNGNRTIRMSLFSWSLAFCCYHIIELRQMEYHDYYMMAYLPLLALASAYGAWHLFQTKWKHYALLLVLIQPALAFVRIVPSRFLTEETDDKQVFYQQEPLNRLQHCVPQNALCVVGPDDSRCIYFYFLNKKGFGFGQEGIQGAQLKEYIQRGARYLYISENQIAENQDISPYLDHLICNERNFYVYSLKIY